MVVERGPWGTHRVAIVPLTVTERQLPLPLPESCLQLTLDELIAQERLRVRLQDPLGTPELQELLC